MKLLPLTRSLLFAAAVVVATLAIAEDGFADLTHFKPQPPAAPSPSLLLEFNVSNYGAWSDGEHDETEAFQRCFDEVAKAKGGLIRIPARTYFLSGKAPIRIPSRTKVIATGARFVLPKKLGDRARITLFEGTDVEDFEWEGGAFEGYVFDPAAAENSWAPNAQTVVFLVKTSFEGTTARLAFRDIKAFSIAGPVVAVKGMPEPDSERDVARYATDVAVDGCEFIKCGRVMWDYGYLWQIVTWPAEHTQHERELAERYFRWDLVAHGHFEPRGSRFFIDNKDGKFALSTDSAPRSMVTFYGEKLPSSVVRGKAYYIVAAADDSIQIANRPSGKPIEFGTAGDGKASVVRDMQAAYWQHMEPTGQGPHVGAVEFTECKYTRIERCTMSAFGDAMLILRCRDNLFANNRILGARMGAVYVGEFCARTLVENNFVDGTNGSRSLSVEKSGIDTVVRGNTFVGAGRGAWINQPRNILIEGNTFKNNTTKGEKNFRRGRRSFQTGDFEAHSELYFTVYEPNGHYSNVVVRNNHFETGPEAIRALAFQRNGSEIDVTGNTFAGPVRTIEVNVSCTNVKLADNRGAARIDQK